MHIQSISALLILLSSSVIIFVKAAPPIAFVPEPQSPILIYVAVPINDMRSLNDDEQQTVDDNSNINQLIMKRQFQGQLMGARGFGKRADLATFVGLNGGARGFGKRDFRSQALQGARGFGKRGFDMALAGARGFGR